MLLKKSLSTRRYLKVVLCAGLAAGLAGCVDYVKRSDTVSLSAGETQAWNKVVHIADPWPPYVMDTDIPGDGQRTAGVIQRYSTGNGVDKSEQVPASSADDVAGSSRK
jgi:hypothetical protein